MRKEELHILLVEDNPADARLTVEMLKESVNPVFSITQVGLIDDALKKLQKGKYDIILLDMNLPDSRGLEGLETITNREPGIPIVILTGLDDEDTGMLALRRHASDYLVKGQINVSLLVRSIRYAIERKQAEEALEAARTQAINDKNRLEAILETLPAGVAILDAKGGIIGSNRMFDEIWSGPRPVTQTVADYANYKAWWTDSGIPVQPEEWASAIAVRKKETVIGQMMYIERFDGKRAFILNSAAPILNAKDEVVECAVAILDLTELNQVEEALRKSEQRYRRLFEDDLTGDYLITPQGEIIVCNPAFAQIFKYESVEQATGTSILSLFPSHDDWNMFISLLKKHKKLEHYDFIRQRMDGQIIYVVENVVGHFDEKNELVEIKGYLFDNTEQIKAEKSMRESEQRFNYLFEYSPIPIIEENLSELKKYFSKLHADGIISFRAHFKSHPDEIDNLLSLIKIVHANQESMSFFSAISKEEILTCLYSHLDELSRDILREKIITLAEGRTRLEIEFPVYVMTGERKIVEHYVSVAPGSEDTLERVLISFVDISARKQTEELRRYKELFDNVDDSVFIIDNKDNFLEVNDGIIRKLGFSKDELLNKSFTDLISQEKKLFYKQIKKRMLKEKSVHYEIELRNNKNDIIPFYLNCHIITYKGEKCSLCVGRDMTELKRLQSEIIRSERLAATGQLTANIVHEIKNPLSIIGGFAKSIEKNYENKERIFRNVNIINQEINRLEQLLSDMLNYSKPLFPKKSKTDIHDLIVQTLNLFENTFIVKNIKVFKHFANDTLIYDLDASQFQEVLINLIQNAVNAMPSGGTLEIITLINNDKLGISIKDTGIGISSKNLEKIFDPFFTTCKNGTGLGLSISQKIVQSHDGTISTTSKEGLGTTFNIQLPLPQPADSLS